MKKKAKRIASLITVLSTLTSAQAVNAIAAESTDYLNDTVRNIYEVEQIYSKGTISPINGEDSKLMRDQIAKAYDFYKKLGWENYDGQGNKRNNIRFINRMVNPDRDVPSIQSYNTMAINGCICIGKETYNNVNHAQDYDIIAHEFTHLVTESKLEWNGANADETFCLAEAYSDIMGELSDEKCDWKIGADVYEEMGYSMRDIAYPFYTEKPLSEDRMYENEYFIDYDKLKPFIDENGNLTLSNQIGSVSNVTRGSLVISHAAYFMNVNGIPRDDLALLWYRSMDKMKDITKETKHATFSDCRKAVVAATDIFSGYTRQRYLNIINAAFDQANVYIDGDVNDDGITDTKDIAVLYDLFYGKRDKSVLNSYRKIRSADVNHDGVLNYSDYETLKNEVITSESQSTLGSDQAMDTFIDSEKEKFPEGKFWKSNCLDQSDSDRYSNYNYNDENDEVQNAPGKAKTVDNYVTLNSTFYKGYDSSFDTAAEEPYYQCAGFAKRLQYDYFGTTKYLKLKDLNGYEPRVGDHLRFTDNHSIFITAVNGNSFTYADCNSDHKCVIKWDQQGEIFRNSSNNIDCFIITNNKGSRIPYTFDWVERPLMVGDVNGDSYVDSSDVNALEDMIGTNNASNDLGARYRFIAADIDQNGVIDSNDSSALAEKINSGIIDLGYIK